MTGTRHPYDLVLQARALKSQGDSVTVIARALGLSRSTIGGWVRGMDEEPAMIHYCGRCGDAFLARRCDARFCPGGCEQHRRVARPPRAPRVCALASCGIEFRRPGPAKFCCAEHRVEHRRGDRRRTCQWCRCQFEAFPASRRYCCPDHKRLAVNARRQARRERWCPFCGTKFIGHGNQVYCTKKHQRLHHPSAPPRRLRVAA